jgi:CheY-like chemotaxis protein
LRKRILAVDDQRHIPRLVQISLERAGYEVDLAYDGIEALQKVRESGPDLVKDWKMEQKPLFEPYPFGSQERERLDRDGHLILPGIVTEEACARLTASLAAIQAIVAPRAEQARRYAAEHDRYLASLIAHPQLLALARQVLGSEIRYDHCVALNRPPGDRGIHWHSHEYADDRPELGFVRIFFYVNGFTAADGGLGVVPGSHLFRDARIHAASDAELRAGWLAGKHHPVTGDPLEIEYLSAPAGSVVLVWTHAAHAVSPRQPGSSTRWAVVYAYRNPGVASRARWITEEFERQPPEDAEGLMGQY